LSVPVRHSHGHESRNKLPRGESRGNEGCRFGNRRRECGLGNIEHSTSNAEHQMDGGGDVSRLLQMVSRAGSSFLIFLVRIYQLTLSPAKMFIFGPSAECRFQPSCSQYAIEALKTHGAAAGGWLAAKRVCRCHPWGECGEDAVPPRKSKVQGCSGIMFEGLSALSVSGNYRSSDLPHPGPLPKERENFWKPSEIQKVRAQSSAGFRI
jgi:uncharacterized protein